MPTSKAAGGATGEIGRIESLHRVDRNKAVKAGIHDDLHH
jgi:hypothetical protein